MRLNLGIDLPTGRLLIFVNPNSGAGNGMKTFNQRMQPLLSQRGIAYELVVTKGPGQAEQAARERTDLAEFAGVLIVSGDGLVFEWLNGLCARGDSFSLVPHLPIGIVPSGSGNGLLASVFASKNYPLKGEKFLDKAIRISTSASSVAVPVNLIHVQTDRKNIVSFLSFGWGLLADIDIESERWRRTLGSSRFVAGALIRCLNLRSYRGKLSFLPYDKSTRTTSPYAYPVHPCSAKERATIEPRRQRNRDDSAYSSTTFPREDDQEWEAVHSVHDVPNIERPIPEQWTTIDDDFVFVYAMAKSHIANDGPLMPQAKTYEDRIYLTYAVRRDCSRIGLARFLNDIETASHLDAPFFKVIEVSAFRLEPEIEGSSYLVVDGEVVTARSIQATVTRLHSTIMVANETV
ncbi:unnamed protein product, partial [Mesorhabditis spiculigera]